MVGTSKHTTPSSHLKTDDPDLDRLLNPAQSYKHPRDVIDDARLDLSEKRAILSSWASDACAVESMPALRQIPGTPAPVSFDDVMDALRRLDDFARRRCQGADISCGQHPPPDHVTHQATTLEDRNQWLRAGSFCCSYKAMD